MDIRMLIIVLVIVIPGYFLVKRLSGTLYSDNQKMEEETERRYGFQRLENEIIEKAKEKEIDEILIKSDLHKRAPKKIVRVAKKTDNVADQKSIFNANSG
jgi:predicted Holliday junction resolvase-like endonuclease